MDIVFGTMKQMYFYATNANRNQQIKITQNIRNLKRTMATHTTDRAGAFWGFTKPSLKSKKFTAVEKLPPSPSVLPEDGTLKI